MFKWFLCFVVLAFAAPAVAQDFCSAGKWTDQQCIRADHAGPDTCKAIKHFAIAHDLDPGFFARLIWQESRFDRNALSHANAMGIAQFIASTAKLRGLDDPYNPALALEHSAQYLAELTAKYGNHGLAAAAYNGGEGRVDRFFTGGGFARETIDYVQIITGHGVEDWKEEPYPLADYRLDKSTPFLAACIEMARSSKLSPLRKPPPALKPWGVRLAWGNTRDLALAAYKRNTSSCRAILGPEKLDLVTIKNRVRGRSAYVMAHIGRNTKGAAGRLCTQLQNAGCRCTVFRNP